jgi:hypothetical protein
MNHSMERSRGEIALLAVAVIGTWLFIWAVILVSKWLGAAAVAITLAALWGLAMCDSD